MRERFTLFVYGQLRRGGIGYRLLGLDERTEWLGEARVRGTLYDLGDYPGLVLGGEGVVHGELLAFGDPALWDELDAYEDCDPQHPETLEYRRVKIDLLDAGAAWAYVYGRAVPNIAPIVSGVWRAR